MVGIFTMHIWSTAGNLKPLYFLVQKFDPEMDQVKQVVKTTQSGLALIRKYCFMSQV